MDTAYLPSVDSSPNSSVKCALRITMFHKKLASVSFGRAFVVVVSAIFMLQLAGCSQTAPEADSFSTGQSVPSTAPVATPHPDKSAINSPHTGLEARQIKALSPKDIITFTDESSLFSIKYPPEWALNLSSISDVEDDFKKFIKGKRSDVPEEGPRLLFLAAASF